MSEGVRTHIGGEYELLEELGSGGMAEVYKARQKRLGRLVALKLLPSYLTADPEACARFEREARAGALLEHDHIVTTFDWGIYEGQPYVAVAFIDGESLVHRIRSRGRLSPEETVALLAPIARALAYAHRKGVIHRDVKSGNIMIRARDERPILIDFGAVHSSFTYKLTRKGDALGTPEYMSPEQASAQPIDARSDLYSLGVVLYECLTGRLPFESPHTEVLIANIKREPHLPVRDQVAEVPTALAQVVDRCLAKDPAERFPDGDALAQALQASVATPQHHPRAHPPRRRRYLAWGALLLTLLVLGTLAYGSTLFSPEDESDPQVASRRASSSQPEEPSTAAPIAPTNASEGAASDSTGENLPGIEPSSQDGRSEQVEEPFEEAVQDTAFADDRQGEAASPTTTQAATSAPAYETYRNEKFGYRLDYPANILRPRNELESGQGHVFVSASGDAGLVTYAIDNGTAESLREKYQTELALPGQEVTYQRIRSGWFVISGHKGEKIFYKKAVLSGGDLLYFNLTYDAASKSYYDPVVQHVASSMRK